jgi:hypothetical protein
MEASTAPSSCPELTCLSGLSLEGFYWQGLPWLQLLAVAHLALEKPASPELVLETAVLLGPLAPLGNPDIATVSELVGKHNEVRCCLIGRLNCQGVDQHKLCRNEKRFCQCVTVL